METIYIIINTGYKINNGSFKIRSDLDYDKWMKDKLEISGCVYK